MVLFTAAEIRVLDQALIKDYGIPGISLMKRAARACIDSIDQYFSDITRFVIFCGSGNNAGDGYLVAAMLADKGHSVEVVALGDQDKLTADARQALVFCQQSSAHFGHCEVIPEDCLIVDALLGIGVTGEVRSEYAKVIEQINESTADVLSVDLPSGLCADTGVILGTCVKATISVTFIGRKRGLYCNDGPDVTGKVRLSDLDAPAEIYKRVAEPVKILPRQSLPKRSRRGYKNQYGHVLLVGGNDGMAGAIILAAEAALRAGAGLVTVATRPENLIPLLTRCPEVMAHAVAGGEELATLLEKADSVVVGPGLGRNQWALELFAAVLSSGKPMVVDADALNMLAVAPRYYEHWILTPHSKEAARLLGVASVQDDRYKVATELRGRYGGVAVLKGLGSLVHGGEQFSLCPFGNPGMATAGMGDVLAGVIGSLIGQTGSLYEAACMGVVNHARAAEYLATQLGEVGLTASDLPLVIGRLLSGEEIS
ncbi:MAG: NAD(P)H-hydrate dehydratase [Gammaproteobacteria bacterium]|jgi:ADP-dependent NAD(P)H-hydrate dehydratase / NAD(P)H-hydrate epimerase|nr:NAD(P)H-hydrate dehydratase [Gammaproteobacteria bacterium]MBT5202096.1 NAD(P)H-hydrate dehydratase [Gammaproteobacteria bacterium]MBT5601171.1 NAD(P)H-hydrate dehydratase [Gammaproteobacteria bacterium]MBT6247326.1 NAD(P)H-hydrate dehydratase [Gammaproteobacteria bacterium]